MTKSQRLAKAVGFTVTCSNGRYVLKRPDGSQVGNFYHKSRAWQAVPDFKTDHNAWARWVWPYSNEKGLWWKFCMELGMAHEDGCIVIHPTGLYAFLCDPPGWLDAALSVLEEGKDGN